MLHRPPSPSEGSECAAGYVLNLKMHVLLINVPVLIIKWMLSTARDKRIYPKSFIPVLQMEHLNRTVSKTFEKEPCAGLC